MRLITILTSLSICFAILTDASAQQMKSWRETLAKKEGVINCIWNESYGIVYPDKNGKMQGVGIQVLVDFQDFVKKKYGVDLTVDFTEEKAFSVFLKRISSSSTHVLGLSNVSITKEREQIMKFTPYFLTNPIVIVTHKDAPKLMKIEDIGEVYDGHTIRVIRGSRHAAIAKSVKEKYFPQVQITESETSREIFQEVSANKKVITIIDFGELLGASTNATNKLPLVNQVAKLNVDDKIGMAMNKGSDWDQVWNEFLTESYRKSIGYKKAVADNLGVTYLNLMNK